MVKELPIFKGYTVDVRLREFRKVEYGRSVDGLVPYIEFIPFDSPQGQQLLSELEAEIHVDAYDEWTCICGNTSLDEGFYPCDAEGNRVDPTPEEWTTNLYRCDRCFRKINQATHEIVA